MAVAASMKASQSVRYTMAVTAPPTTANFLLRAMKASEAGVPAPSVFSFLAADDGAKVARALLLYAAAGQLECVRVSARQLATLHAPRARDVLLELVTHPPATRTSAALPSTAHLAWLAYAELRALAGPGAAPVPSDVLAALHFDMALHACRAVASHEQAKLLDRLRDLAGVG